jgi:hypothetical protein
MNWFASQGPNWTFTVNHSARRVPDVPEPATLVLRLNGGIHIAPAGAAVGGRR